MLNNVVLMGRLVAAPELKQTTSGNSVTAFCIAVDRRYTTNGEKQSDFINCVAWRNTAEFIARYFGKGDMIAVTGEIQTRKYKDKDGNNRVAVEVVVGNASFCGGKSESNGNAAQPAGTGSEPSVGNGGGMVDLKDDDDLPF